MESPDIQLLNFSRVENSLLTIVDKEIQVIGSKSVYSGKLIKFCMLFWMIYHSQLVLSNNWNLLKVIEDSRLLYEANIYEVNCLKLQKKKTMN